jgi:hypothetical protein
MEITKPEADKLIKIIDSMRVTISYGENYDTIRCGALETNGGYISARGVTLNGEEAERVQRYLQGAASRMESVKEGKREDMVRTYINGEPTHYLNPHARGMVIAVLLFLMLIGFLCLVRLGV